MNTFAMAKEKKDEIMQGALINALAVVAFLGKKEDEISEREAFIENDRGWIKDRTERGLLHFSRKGKTKRSAKIYSRFEITSLKWAEKCITEQVKMAISASKEITDKINE